MRLAVLLALLLGVLLSLPNAVAVRSATVNSATTVAVVSTSQALISLEPGAADGNASGTAAYRDTLTQDALVLDFTKGLNAGTSYGFPPNALAYRDQFRYRGLFTVTNRSDETLCISAYVPGGGVADLAAIYLRSVGDTGTGTAAAGSGGSALPCAASLAPDGVFEVNFWWEIGSGSDTVQSFTVRVEGSR